MSLLLLSLVVLMVQTAPAQDEGYVPPRWDRSGEPRYLKPGEITHPYFATIANIAGRADLDCLVTVAGRVGDCRAVLGTPRGLGFDRIALQQSEDFRFFAATRDGQPVEARVIFSVHFPPEDALEEIDTAHWPRPSETALAAMRPVAEALQQIVEARKEVWDVDPAREATVEKLYRDALRELRSEHIEASALSLARALTLEEARALLDAPDPIAAWGLLDRIHLAAPESQNLDGRFQRRLKDRYCTIYDCEIAPRSPD